MNKDKEIEAACKDWYKIDKEIVKDWDNPPQFSILETEKHNFLYFTRTYFYSQDKNYFKK